jgi:plasmid stabilization system protein ParE
MGAAGREQPDRARRLDRAAGLLATSPRMSRVVPELRNRELREVIVGAYRILYRHRNDSVEIVTIVHSARLLR